MQEVAIIGLGRFGTSVALAIAKAGCSVVGVDRDPALVQDLADQLADVVQADATDEAVLRQLGIPDFDVAVVAIGADFESNLLASVALKQLGARRVIAKALTQRQADILYKIGVDEVVLPEHQAGEQLAARLLLSARGPLWAAQGDVPAVELLVPEAWAGRTLAELNLPREHGLLIVSLRRGGELIIAPGADQRIAAGDRALLVGPLARLRAYTRTLATYWP